MNVCANPLVAGYRWANRQGENFTTEVFASLLALLDKREPVVAREFAAWLWKVPVDAVSGPWRLQTQVALTKDVNGCQIPDLFLSTPTAALLIEVKTGNAVDAAQLRGYEALLREHGSPLSKLVSLSARVARIDSPDDTCDWLWTDVAVRLRQHLAGIEGCPRIEDCRCRCAVEQLDEFLQDRLLAFGPIRTPLSEGIHRHVNEFRNRPNESPLLAGDQKTLDRLQGFPELKPLLDLMLLVRTILEAPPGKEKTTVGSSADWWYGLNVNQLEFLCMIELKRPDVLVLERGHPDPSDKTQRWKATRNLADMGFFQLNEAGQRHVLTEFLTTGLADGRKHAEGNVAPPQRTER